MIVTGLDLSLRAAAMVAIPEEWARGPKLHRWDLVRFRTVGSPLAKSATSDEQTMRLIELTDAVLAFVEEARQIDLDVRVYLEGYAFAAHGTGPNLGELGGAVKVALYREGLSVVPVTSSTARKTLFGVGRFKKGIDTKKEIERRMEPLGAPFVDHDQRDAFTIANHGLTILGLPAMMIPE